MKRTSAIEKYRKKKRGTHPSHQVFLGKTSLSKAFLAKSWRQSVAGKLLTQGKSEVGAGMDPPVEENNEFQTNRILNGVI